MQFPHHLAPWGNIGIVCDFTLSADSKHIVSTVVKLQDVFAIQYKYRDFREFFTDGTSTSSYVGCAVYFSIFTHVERISINDPIFAAGFYAVFIAIEYNNVHQILKTVVYFVVVVVVAVLKCIWQVQCRGR